MKNPQQLVSQSVQEVSSERSPVQVKPDPQLENAILLCGPCQGDGCKVCNYAGKVMLFEHGDPATRAAYHEQMRKEALA